MLICALRFRQNGLTSFSEKEIRVEKDPKLLPSLTQSKEVNQFLKKNNIKPSQIVGCAIRGSV